ncbi:MAG: SMP-30/gluconolactonase/LRE family protein [Sphingomonadales bacterium]|nr:SMP-30/gluconolactonase/LRE family protein [Sphingomonadales bacterium]
MKIERVATQRCGLGEGAVWDHEAKALYFLDIFGKTVFRYDPASGETQSWQTPTHVGALALREGGGAVLAMGDSLHAFDFASGEVTKLAGPAFTNPRVTINDGAADRAGRFVFGGCSAGMDDPQPIGGLYALNTDHTITELDRGTHQSNSHCFAPDGRTLYAADSFVKTLYAYDYDPATGQVSSKRVLAETADLGGVPDGSAVDADGVVWVSIFEAGKIAAYRPDGRLERVVEMPVKLISSLAWGGENLDRLYVTTIDPTSFGWAPEAGGGNVYVVDGLGSRGVPEARYAG